MNEELVWNSVSDIILQYKLLDENQGFKIYYKTRDYDNTGEEVIVSQIIPARHDIIYSNDIPIQAHGRMKNFITGVQIIGWDIYEKRFEVNLDHITKIEIVENAIDEILREEYDEESSWF